MKQAQLIVMFATFASTLAMAKPILTCKSSGANGSLVKQVTVEDGQKGYIVKIESYAGEGLNEIKILRSISMPVSSKLVLDANTGAKTSLVIYKKQAVVLYEAQTAADFNKNGAAVEFLTCK